MSFVWLTANGSPAGAQPADPSGRHVEKQPARREATALAFLGGAATALATHEASHVLFDLMFDAHPGVKGVNYGGVPFFAITHRPVSRRREYIISAAGLWTQHALDEWLLSTRPDLRRERAPFAKGVLAFNVIAGLAYSGAAITRTGPPERDTRGMAQSAGPNGIDERWIGVLVLSPAALDAYRYFAPHARWATWTSRALKAGTILLVLR